jgi:hypothetical protein
MTTYLTRVMVRGARLARAAAARRGGVVGADGAL